MLCSQALELSSLLCHDYVVRCHEIAFDPGTGLASASVHRVGPRPNAAKSNRRICNTMGRNLRATIVTNTPDAGKERPSLWQRHSQQMRTVSPHYLKNFSMIARGGLTISLLYYINCIITRAAISHRPSRVAPWTRSKEHTSSAWKPPCHWTLCCSIHTCTWICLNRTMTTT